MKNPVKANHNVVGERVFGYRYAAIIALMPSVADNSRTEAMGFRTVETE
jgi:hypothetical protein